MNYQTLNVTETNGIMHIELNRVDKANAIDAVMWEELKSAFDSLSRGSARVGVLSGRGNHFSAGIDLGLLATLRSDICLLPEGRRQEQLRNDIAALQETVTAAEVCTKPLLAAIHGACLGAGVDLITACDMRYATEDAKFSVKEVDLAIIADLGTLQRMPRLIGEGLTRELAFTGREFSGNEAKEMKLVNRIFPNKESLFESVMEIAEIIASKSPLAIRGIKDTLNFSRDHSVSEGLAYISAKNSAMLFSSDAAEAFVAIKEKRLPKFED